MSFILTLYDYSISAAQCEVPQHMRGSFFSMETNDEVNTELNPKEISNEGFQGECVERLDINRTNDAGNNHDSKILFYDR